MRLFLLICALVLQGFDAYRVICVYTNWAQYRPDGGKFMPEDVDATLCTHLIYVYAKLKGNKLAPAEWNDEGTAWREGMYERVNNLKQVNPELKTLLGVGGWMMGSKDFSNLASGKASRRMFASSTVKFLRDRNFDGLAVDWQHPTKRGGKAKDKTNYSLLLQELRATFDEDSKKTGQSALLLAAGVSASREIIDDAYEIDNLTKYVDFVNIMAYDLHGSWDNYTGHPSQLYARESEFGPSAELNVDGSMRYWMSQVLDKSKLILGVSTYGRTFTLRKARHNDYNVPTTGPGLAGEFTQQPGMLAYYERCSQYADATRVWDETSQVAYWYQGDQWAAGEDTESIKAKVDWMRLNHVGGIMFSPLDMDDFSGTFCNEDVYPLLKSLHRQLHAPLPANARPLRKKVFPAAPKIMSAMNVYTSSAPSSTVSPSVWTDLTNVYPTSTITSTPPTKFMFSRHKSASLETASKEDNIFRQADKILSVFPGNKKNEPQRSKSRKETLQPIVPLKSESQHDRSMLSKSLELTSVTSKDRKSFQQPDMTSSSNTLNVSNKIPAAVSRSKAYSESLNGLQSEHLTSTDTLNAISTEHSTQRQTSSSPKDTSYQVFSSVRQVTSRESFHPTLPEEQNTLTRSITPQSTMGKPELTANNLKKMQQTTVLASSEGNTTGISSQQDVNVTTQETLHPIVQQTDISLSSKPFEITSVADLSKSPLSKRIIVPDARITSTQRSQSSSELYTFPLSSSYKNLSILADITPITSTHLPLSSTTDVSFLQHQLNVTSSVKQESIADFITLTISTEASTTGTSSSFKNPMLKLSSTSEVALLKTSNTTDIPFLKPLKKDKNSKTDPINEIELQQLLRKAPDLPTHSLLEGIMKVLGQDNFPDPPRETTNRPFTKLQSSTVPNNIQTTSEAPIRTHMNEPAGLIPRLELPQRKHSNPFIIEPLRSSKSGMSATPNRLTHFSDTASTFNARQRERKTENINSLKSFVPLPFPVPSKNETVSNKRSVDWRRFGLMI